MAIVYPLVPLAVSGLVSAWSAAYSAKNANALADYNATIHNRNAALARQEAAYAKFQAARNATDKRVETAGHIGTQRAGQGASGVLVGSGSSLETVADTAEQGERAAMALLQEGDLEAWRAENRARNHEAAAAREKLSKTHVGGVVAGSLLSTAARLGKGYFALNYQQAKA